MSLRLLPQGGGDAQSIGDALRGIAGPLLRNLRRFEVLRAAQEALPAEMRGACAPYDVRMAPTTEVGSGGDDPHVNTVYFYVGSATVGALLEQRKRALLSRINAALATQLVEDIRCEQASAARIAEQVNILEAEPD